MRRNLTRERAVSSSLPFSSLSSSGKPLRFFMCYNKYSPINFPFSNRGRSRTRANDRHDSIGIGVTTGGPVGDDLAQRAEVKPIYPWKLTFECVGPVPFT